MNKLVALLLAHNAFAQLSEDLEKLAEEAGVPFDKEA